MSEPRFQFGWLNDSRLAAQALSPTPVWLWSAATNRILWANPVAAAIFDAPSPQAAAAIDFGPRHAAAMQIAPGTVGSTLNAARRNLARALGDDDGDRGGKGPVAMTNEEAADASP